MITAKKSLSLQIALCLGLFNAESTHTELSPKALTDCYEGIDSSFKYLEFVFIEQPADALNAQIQQAQAVILTIVPAYIIARNLTHKEHVQLDIPVTISVGVLGKIIVDLYNNYVNKNIKHNSLVKFLKNWDFHRQYIPTQLIPAFDELAQSFTASSSKTFSNEQVSEIFAVIQHLLEHEFSKRYEKDKKKSVDTLGILKTITDISKNLK